MRVEDADVLGVEQSNGPGGVALIAGAGHLVKADGSGVFPARGLIFISSTFAVRTTMICKLRSHNRARNQISFEVL